MHSRWGGAEGAKVYFGQKRFPALLGPSIGFCGASVNFPFRGFKKGGGRMGGAQWGLKGGGDFPLMHSWPLQSGHF